MDVVSIAVITEGRHCNMSITVILVSHHSSVGIVGLGIVGLGVRVMTVRVMTVGTVGICAMGGESS